MARRKRRRRGVGFFDVVTAFAFFAGVGVVVVYLGTQAEQEIQGRVKVIDGDSLVLNGAEIRLQGIDAPEGRQKCRKYGSEWLCGRQAARHLRKLASGGAVKCTGWQQDKYNRLLANCRRNDVDLNRAMVRDGWAVSYGGYEREEAEARRRAVGIWTGEFNTPQQWRREQRFEREQAGPGWLDKISDWRKNQ